MNKNIEEHTAGPIAIGFDYQFYLFMFLALKLKHGQKIGFEVKDDIHIDLPDGATILLQAKHTIQQNIGGDLQNLTTLDTDLWKTLSNWANRIKADKTKADFLNNHSFILVTNKGENKNDFIDALSLFRLNSDIEAIIKSIKAIENQTQDKVLKKYIKNVDSLGKRKLKSFLLKLTIETNVDGIIEKISNRLIEVYRDAKIAEAIFEKLYSNLQKAKYLDIKGKNKFEISFDDFTNKFGRCFKIASEEKPLPKRSFPILLPDEDDLENQLFIRQLLDIGEVQSGSSDIRDYTTKMLVFLRHFTYWSDEENFILLTDAEDFKRNSIQIWKNKFKAKYRQIENQINSGTSINDLEDEIKKLGIELVDYIREQNLTIQGFSPLGIEFSNGHFYALSDNLEIGWHLDWKNKYTKE